MKLGSSSAFYTITVADLTGRMILHLDGSSEQVGQGLAQFTPEFRAGVYLIRIVSDGIEVKKTKVVKL